MEHAVSGQEDGIECRLLMASALYGRKRSAIEVIGGAVGETVIYPQCGQGRAAEELI